jgi:hypothetical protein
LGPNVAPPPKRSPPEKTMSPAMPTRRRPLSYGAADGPKGLEQCPERLLLLLLLLLCLCV